MITAHKSESHLYVLEQIDGQWVLTVVCGGFAMFTRRLVLTKDEVDRIDGWGEYYVQKLALDIAKEPSLFGDRLKS